jgi:glycosyltransferase involved in cell wall biosynthesis
MELNIAVIAPVWIPVPPEGYGGIERVIKLLVDELVRMGQDVTLFAAGGSSTLARQVTYIGKAPTERMGDVIFDAIHVGKAYKDIARSDCDVIHDNSGLLGPAFAGLMPQPVVHTLHGPFTDDISMFYSAFSQTCFYVAISKRQQETGPDLNYLGVVPNAVDIEEHRYASEKDDYLVNIGRICETKGTEQAVRLAREAGRRIFLAGKIDAGADMEYYETRVRPLLDGKQAIYLGEITQAEKVDLLSHARAFLFPIQWEEPFGLVMAESLACGTPVLATRFGAAAEVIEDGVTGFLADTWQELANYIDRIDEIDPLTCRREAERRFSPRVMAENYMAIFSRAVELYRGKLHKTISSLAKQP